MRNMHTRGQTTNKGASPASVAPKNPMGRKIPMGAKGSPMAAAPQNPMGSKIPMGAKGSPMAAAPQNPMGSKGAAMGPRNGSPAFSKGGPVNSHRGWGSARKPGAKK